MVELILRLLTPRAPWCSRPVSPRPEGASQSLKGVDEAHVTAPSQSSQPAAGVGVRRKTFIPSSPGDAAALRGTHFENRRGPDLLASSRCSPSKDTFPRCSFPRGLAGLVGGNESTGSQGHLGAQLPEDS